MKKICLLGAAILGLLLAACSVFDAEYVSIEDYYPTVQSESSDPDKVIVRNITSLKQAIRRIVSSGGVEGKIVFDASYEGEPSEDMSKACWQVRTQDALCAYCVENISYEFSKIVTYYEARLTISYTDFAGSIGEIERLPYSTGIEMKIKNALSAGKTKLVMLVDRSSYSAEDMENLVSQVYRQNPATAPREPYTSVNMFSGSNMQRLYEVNMRYGLTAEELTQRKQQLSAFAPFIDADYSSLDDAQRALIAYNYIRENCTVDERGSNATVYSALIEKHADSEGLALAYVELCRQLDVECQIVYGQRDWKSHCWNIVSLDGAFYHVDTAVEQNVTPMNSFMKRDEDFWERYRWDMSSYPVCSGELSIDDALLELQS